MPELRKLLTVKDVAEILACSSATVRQIVRYGELPYIRCGRGTERRHVVFDPKDIEAYIQRSKQRDIPPFLSPKMPW